MNEYKKAVEAALARRNGDPVIANRSVDHAAVVLECMFKAANRTVEIIANRLNPAVYDKPEVIAAAEALLSAKNCTIDVLVESDVAAERQFVRVLTAKYPNKFSIVHVPAEVAEAYSYNFCVVDDDCYRFEADRKNCDATIQFGNTAIASKIHETFKLIKSECLSYRGKAEVPA